MNITYKYNEKTKAATLSLENVPEEHEEIIAPLFAAAAKMICNKQGFGDKAIKVAEELLTLSVTEEFKSRAES